MTYDTEKGTRNMTQVCRFCDRAAAITAIDNPANGGPLPACGDCLDQWDEQEYNNQQAEESYARYVQGEPLASVDHARLLGRDKDDDA